MMPRKFSSFIILISLLLVSCASRDLELKKETIEINSRSLPQSQNLSLTKKGENKKSFRNRKYHLLSMENNTTSKLKNESQHHNIHPSKKETKQKGERKIIKEERKLLPNNNNSSKEIKETLKSKIIDIAKLTLLKKMVVIKKVNNVLIEAIPQNLQEKCKKIFIRVKSKNKNEKKGFVVSICGNKIKINSL